MSIFITFVFQMPSTVKLSTKEDLMQEHILQAAQHLFQKHGFQKVTMDDVARAIGKGRSSLYYYYKNKDEVFNAVIDIEITEMLAELGRVIDAVTTVEERMRIFFITKIKIARKKRAFFAALESGMNADEMSQYAKKKQIIRKRLTEGEGGLLRGVILSGIKNRELPGMEPVDIDTTVFVLLTSLHGLKLEMMAANDFSRLESAVEILTRMAMRAIGR